MQTDRLTLVLVLIVGISATAIGLRNLIGFVKFVQPFLDIERTSYPKPAPIQHMGIHHSCLNIFVP